MDDLFFGTINDHCCGKLREHCQFVSLMTKLGLLEGVILEKIEESKMVTLQELMVALHGNPCIITMAVGSLIRQGVIRSSEHGQDVFLERQTNQYSEQLANH